MERREIPGGRWRPLLAGCGLYAALLGLAVAEPAAPEAAPALRASRLQASAPELRDERYLLRARLMPVPVRRDVSGTFALRTALAAKGAAACEAGLLFQDGFESP